MVFHKLYAIVIFTALFKSGQSFYESSNVLSQPSIQTSKASHVSPHTVAIIRDKDWQKRCVGTLISDSLVLTAAQCVDCESAELILGAYDILVSEKTQIRQSIDKSHIIFHPLYDYRTLDNDIALIRLPQKVKITPFVNVVQLPDSDFRVEYGTNAYITGWEHSPNGYSNILSQVELTLISRDKCISFWPMGRINYSKMCASASHRHGHLHELLGTECIIDPGSPLTLHGNPDTLIGILTGESTCGSSLPEIFVNVAQYKDWIDAELGRDLRVIEVITSTTSKIVQDGIDKQIEDIVGGSSTKEVNVTVEDNLEAIKVIENDTSIVKLEGIVEESSAKGVETKPEVINVNSGQDKIEPVVNHLEEILTQHLEVEPLDYPVLKSWKEIPPLLEIIPQPMDAVQFDYSSLVQLETPLLNLVDIVPQTINNYPAFGDLVQESPLFNLGGDIISPSLETILIDSPSSGFSSYNLIGEIIPQPLDVSPLITIGDAIPQSFETSVFDIPLLGDWNLAPPSYTLLGDIAYQPIDAGVLGYPYNLVGEVTPQPFDTTLIDYPLLGDWNLAPPSYTLIGDITSQFIDAGSLGNSYNLAGDFIPQPFDTTLLDYPLLGDWNLAPPSYTLLGDLAYQPIDAGVLGYPYNLVGEVTPQPFDTTLIDYPLLGDWNLAPPSYTLLGDITSQFIDAGSLGNSYNLVGNFIPQPFDTTLLDYPLFGDWNLAPPSYTLLGDITSQSIDAGLLGNPLFGEQQKMSPLYSAGGIIGQPLGSSLSDYSPFANWVGGIVPKPLDNALFDYLTLGDTPSILQGDIIHQGVPTNDYPPFGEWEGVSQQHSTNVNEIKPENSIKDGEITPQLEEITVQHTESDSIHVGEDILQPEDSPHFSDESIILYPSEPLISDVYFEPVETDETSVVIPDENFDLLPGIIVKEDSNNKEQEAMVTSALDGLEGVKVEDKPNYDLAEGVNIVNNLEGVLEATVEDQPGYGLKEGLEVVVPDVPHDIILEENLKNKEGADVEILEGGLEEGVKAVLGEKPNYGLAEGANIENNLEGVLEGTVEDQPGYGLMEGLEVVVPDVSHDIILEENLKNKEGANVEILEGGLEEGIKAVLGGKPDYGLAEGENIVNDLEEVLEAVVVGKPDYGLKEGLEVVDPDVLFDEIPDITLEQNFENEESSNIVEILKGGLEEGVKAVLEEKPNYGIAEGENIVNNLEGVLEGTVEDQPGYGLKEVLEFVVPDVSHDIILEENLKNKEGANVEVLGGKPDYGLAEAENIVNDLEEVLEAVVVGKPDYGLKEGLEVVDPDVLFDKIPDITIEKNFENEESSNIVEILKGGLEDGVKAVLEEKPNYGIAEGENIVNNLEGVLEGTVEDQPGYGLKEVLEFVVPDVSHDIILEENLKNKEGANVEVLGGKRDYGLAEAENIVNDLEEVLEAVVVGKPDYGLKEGLEVVDPDVLFEEIPDITLEQNLKNEESSNIVEILKGGLEEGVKAVLEEKPNYGIAEGENIVNNLEGVLEGTVENQPGYGLKEGLEVVVPDVSHDIILEENLKNKEGANVEVLGGKPDYGLAEAENIVNDLEEVLEAVVVGKPDYGLKEGLEVVDPDVLFDEIPDITLEQNLKNEESSNIVEILKGGLEEGVKADLEKKPNYGLAEGENIVNNLEEVLEGTVEDKPNYGLKEGLEVLVENNPDRDLRQELNDVPDVTPEEHLKKLGDGIVTIKLHLSDLKLRPDWYKDGKLTADDLPFKVSENAIIQTEIDPTELVEEYYV